MHRLVLARMGCLYCRLAFELPTQARQLGRQATRVLLMVMEPPRVPLMMMEPPCVNQSSGSGADCRQT